MASRVGKRILPCLESTDLERPAPALTSDLHEEIFLRVASPADLARASAACVAFHRLVTDPAFLRRYRSIHPPLFLGFICPTAGFQPAEPPHPSAAVAAAVARAADFSYDYIPRTTTSFAWYPCDVRDGHVLVSRFMKQEHDGEKRLSLDFAVSDPFSRLYLLLPPMADDLLASVGLENDDVFTFGASFVPSGDMEDETPFSAMCWMYSETKLVVFFFSSGYGCWTVGTSASWDELGLHDEEEVESLSLGSCQKQFVHGCFYWKIKDIDANKLLKLDMSTMELSIYNLPPDHDDRDIVIVVSGEGNVAMFSKLCAGTSVGYYNLLQNGIDKSYKWHLRSTIPLPAQYTIERYISPPAEGYIFLAATSKEQGVVHSAFFSIEIKSLKIEMVSRKAFPFCCALPYFGFPPSMPPKRIQGYEAKDVTDGIAKNHMKA